MENSYVGNDREKRKVLRRFRKTVSVGAEVTSGGRLLQRRLPATGNARSPTVDSRVRRITGCEDDDDRRRRGLESYGSYVLAVTQASVKPLKETQSTDPNQEKSPTDIFPYSFIDCV